ncbi:MAG: PEP-CTERM sorting domain-containing protein, partial [Deltaproteobacteria bacterium]|nr:PEP-CTERM sorting domain-containing protein [Deltaproteobacteria bacterium]
MLMQARAGALISALAFATVLWLAPGAQAVECSTDHLVAFNEAFNDCAGNQNYLNDAGSLLEHDPGIDGPSLANSWFSDLHITFLDSDVTGVGGGQFVHAMKPWDVEVANTADGVMISFTAPTPADRVNPGEDYRWDTDPLGDIFGLNELNIRIQYTMDVPEPGSLALGLAGLLGLVVACRRQ